MPNEMVVNHSSSFFKSLFETYIKISSTYSFSSNSIHMFIFCINHCFYETTKIHFNINLFKHNFL